MAAKLDSLTALRGIAALSTVLVHLVAVWAQVFPSMQHWAWFQHFARHSYLFVDFFFILSGFVMCHVYADVFRHSVSRTDYLHFMRARFARVYPLHFLLLALYVALAAAGMKQEQENPDWSIAANLLLVQALGFFSYPTWDRPSWSISVEWWTYVIFPFVVMRVPYRHRLAGLAGLAMGTGGFCWLAIHFGSADLTVGFAFVRCLLGFLAGASVYAIAHMRPDRAPSAILTAGIMLAVAAGLTLLPSPVADIVVFLCFCALVYAARSSQPQWLHQRTLVWLGDISYSIYLWHTLLLHAVAKAAAALKSVHPWPPEQECLYFCAALLLFEAGILVTAHLSHKLIELPLQNYFKRDAKLAIRPSTP
jgi:peptidoglycan/LPS O-acetylase OafA/YrhL